MHCGAYKRFVCAPPCRYMYEQAYEDDKSPIKMCLPTLCFGAVMDVLKHAFKKHHTSQITEGRILKWVLVSKMHQNRCSGAEPHKARGLPVYVFCGQGISWTWP